MTHRAITRAVAVLAALLGTPTPARAERPAWNWFGRLIDAGQEVRALAYRTEHLDTVPVAADVISGFGYRRDPIHRGRRLHAGIDFDADRGAPVMAAGRGRVIKARRQSGYGRVVVIDHGNGLTTHYAHLDSIDVARGDLVDAGDVIATVGSTGRTTGPHLHFEVRRHGKAIDPRRELPIGGVILLHAPGS
jgi:murein DD-endopeptidase MepM/ murein hydrolase activator NlpD